MRRRFFIAVLFLALTSFGCGGGGGGTAPAGTPQISNLQYSPHSALVGGSGTVTGTINFTDTDGDLSTLTIIPCDANGNQIGSAATSTILGQSGVTGGVLAIQVSVNTAVQGSYTFKIYVTDGKGYSSNVLTGPFTVT